MGSKAEQGWAELRLLLPSSIPTFSVRPPAHNLISLTFILFSGITSVTRVGIFLKRRAGRKKENYTSIIAGD